jgi:dephospho-CoA kinase
VLQKGVHSLFVAEVPLLYEAQFEGIFDKVILVITQDTTCIQRLLNTGTITKEEYMRRKERFISNKEKRADFIIKNDGTLNELKQNIATIYANLSSTTQTT